MLNVILLSSCNSQETSKNGNTHFDELLNELVLALEKEDISKIKDVIKTDSTILNFPNSKINYTNEIEPILFWTIRNNKYKSFRALLGLGSDVNIKSNTGFTPLIVACQNDYELNGFSAIDYVRDLIEKGADINYIRNGYHKETNGKKKFFRATSPLNAAIQKRNIELASYLIKKGADINAILTEPGMDGGVWKFNALMSAISRKDMQMAKFLLINCGAEYNWILGRDYSNKPLNISYFLRRCYFLKDSSKFKDKMEILEYLIANNVSYKETEIPEKAIAFAKKNYPDNWEVYLENY